VFEKKKNLWKNCFVFLLFLNSILFSKQYTGVLKRDTVFSGRVVIKGDLVVDKGVELKILPGTICYFINEGKDSFTIKKRVKDTEVDFGFGKRTSLIVKGKLIAEGESENTIEFRKIPEKGGRYYWGGIIFVENSEGTLRHVEIEDALVGIAGLDSSKINFELSKIEHCGIGMMLLDNSTVNLNGVNVTNSSTSGMELYGYSKAEVESSIFEENLGKAILLNDFSYVLLRNSRIIRNKVGIAVYDVAKVNMKDNVFKENEITSIGITEEIPEGDYTWSGVLNLDHDIVIPEGKTLIIEPGTVIYVSTRSVRDSRVLKLSGGERVDVSFRGLVDIVIKGDIWAVGEEKKPIVFTTKSKEKGYWGGIIFVGRNSKSKLKNVVIKGAKVAIYTWDASAPLIENTKIVENYMGVVACENSVPILKFCKIFKNVYGIASYDYASPSLRMSFLGSSSKVGFGTRGSSSPYLFKNEIENNEVGVGVFEHSSPKIEKNNIKKNKYGIIALDKSKPSIYENIFVKNESGINLNDYTDAVLLKNKFILNELALKYEVTSNIKMVDNFFEKNFKDKEIHGGGAFTVSGILKENELWKGEVELKGDVLVPSGVTLYIENAKLYFPDITDFDLDIARIISGKKEIITNPGLSEIIVEGKIVIKNSSFLSKKKYIKENLISGGIFIFGEGELSEVEIYNSKVGIGVLGKGVSNLNSITIFGADTGLLIGENSKVNAEGVKIIDCKKGIFLSDNATLKFKRGILSKNGEGILCLDSSYLDLRNTIISKNKKGILVKDEAIAIIDKNVFAKNYMAVEIFSIRMPEFKENKFEENVKTSNFPHLFR